MLFRRTVLTAALVVAAGLPMAGTAAAEQKPAAGWITATDYSSGSPALAALDPVSGDIAGPFVRNAEDGVLSPKGSAVAYIQRDDTCIPQDEGCMYARNLVVADTDGGDQRVQVVVRKPKGAIAGEGVTVPEPRQPGAGRSRCRTPRPERRSRRRSDRAGPFELAPSSRARRADTRVPP